VNGVCIAAGKCEGVNFTGLNGQQQGVGDAKGMMDAMKGVMDMLKQAMQGKQQQQQPQQPTTGLPTTGCTAYYQVTAPSADPCAYYVPPTSDSLLSGSTGLDSSGFDALQDALSGGGSINVSEQLIGNLDTTATQTPPPAPAAGFPTTQNLSGQAVNLQSGTQGDIVVGEGSATIFARARDTQANTEVAGFYGSDTFGSQPQGVVAGMCQNRPWAGSIVSFVIPPSFFDSLCAWRGYQVGTPAPPPPPVIQQTPTPASAASPTPTPTPTASTIPAEVDIWAVPDKVPLGSRTSVFWNSKGVESCTISSPDGSFEEHALSGGAATVPLSGATTFTISCLTSEGKPVTDFVTVNLSI
jgi:hypothetical protein